MLRKVEPDVRGTFGRVQGDEAARFMMDVAFPFDEARKVTEGGEDGVDRVADAVVGVGFAASLALEVVVAEDVDDLPARACGAVCGRRVQGEAQFPAQSDAKQVAREPVLTIGPREV